MTASREIVLDTETTGLYAKSGDRIVEIGCVELVNKVRTGSTYHTYINPQRDIPMESIKIHGISNDFVKDKPTFSKVAKDFLEYIGNSTLIIHNAGFDVSFLNYELALLGYPELSFKRVVDTLILARRTFPGAPASLDALCKRFNISLASREKHGAIIDAELLALVYVELMGGSQSSLDFASPDSLSSSITSRLIREQREPRVFELTEEEKQNHEDLLKRIANPMWKLDHL
jgi:DNA polymerase-3 subunit epsilon